MAWPSKTRGLAVPLRTTKGQAGPPEASLLAEIESQVSVERWKVRVWSSGAEAQTEGDWGEKSLSCFGLKVPPRLFGHNVRFAALALMTALFTKRLRLVNIIIDSFPFDAAGESRGRD